jgi:holo-[acyl-carrier protein] synthase
VFDPAEVSYCDQMADPWQHYAARFAAKEATMKALGTGWSEGVAFSDIVVVRDGNGTPRIELRGEAARRLDGGRLCLSLAHAGDIAVAFVVLEA